MPAAVTDDSRARFLAGEAPAGQFKYDAIPSITKDEAEQYQVSVQRKTAFATEKDALEKYFFKLMIDHRTDNIQIKRELFELYTDSYQKHIIDNMILEKSKVTATLRDTDFDMRVGGIELRNMKAAQLDAICELNRRLGINHSLERTEIPRTKIEEIGDYMREKRAHFHKIFGMRDKSPDAANSVKNTVAMLDKIYTSWTGAGLKSTEKKEKSDLFLKQPLYYTNTLISAEKLQIPVIEIFEKKPLPQIPTSVAVKKPFVLPENWVAAGFEKIA